MEIFKENYFEIVVVDEHDNELKPEEISQDITDYSLDAFNNLIKVFGNAKCPVHLDSGIETIFFFEPKSLKIQMTSCCLIREQLLKLLFQSSDEKVQYVFRALVYPDDKTEDGEKLKKHIYQRFDEKIDISSILDGISLPKSDERNLDSTDD